MTSLLAESAHSYPSLPENVGKLDLASQEGGVATAFDISGAYACTLRYRPLPDFPVTPWVLQPTREEVERWAESFRIPELRGVHTLYQLENAERFDAERAKPGDMLGKYSESIRKWLVREGFGETQMQVLREVRKWLRTALPNGVSEELTLVNEEQQPLTD